MPARRRDGFIAVGDTYEPGALAYYNSDGRYLGTDRRRGAGPGELSGFLQGVMFGPGDSLYAVDIGNRRITVTVPFGVTGSRHVPLPTIPQSAFVMDDGFILLQGAHPTPSRPVQLFHVIGPNGSIKSFGNPGRIFERGRPTDEFRAVTPAAADHEFLAGHLNKLTIERWRFNGDHVNQMHLKRKWFDEWDTLQPGQPFATPPSARLIGLWLETPDRLWLIAHVADRDWRRLEVRGEQRLSPSLRQTMYDTIIEVVDPEGGHAIKTVRYDKVIFPTNMPGTFKMVIEDDVGNISVSLVQLRLVHN